MCFFRSNHAQHGARARAKSPGQWNRPQTPRPRGVWATWKHWLRWCSSSSFRHMTTSWSKECRKRFSSLLTSKMLSKWFASKGWGTPCGCERLPVWEELDVSPVRKPLPFEPPGRILKPIEGVLSWCLFLLSHLVRLLVGETSVLMISTSNVDLNTFSCHDLKYRSLGTRRTDSNQHKRF